MNNFSTLNESLLHKSLKTLYALRYGGKTEIAIGNWVCDIVCAGDAVIEIQTQNLSVLKKKVCDLISIKKKVAIVRPIVAQKKILLFSKNGELIKTTHSTKKESLYSVLRELSGLCDFLLDKNFTLIFPIITAKEQRVQCKTPEQSKNGKRRFKKAWQKTGKSLVAVNEEYEFYGKEAYLSLLPKSLPACFSSQEVAAALPRSEKKHANMLLWILHKIGLIERVPSKTQRYYYTIAK